jgi:hypothetical protein
MEKCNTCPHKGRCHLIRCSDVVAAYLCPSVKPGFDAELRERSKGSIQYPHIGKKVKELITFHSTYLN